MLSIRKYTIGWNIVTMYYEQSVEFPKKYYIYKKEMITSSLFGVTPSDVLSCKRGLVHCFTSI